MDLYSKVSFRASKLVTESYSTSFSLATRLMDSESRQAIYAIYGFVRLADEIVDTFDSHNQSILLEEFKEDYKKAIERGISLNPVLNSFCITINQYSVPSKLIEAFMSSMERDLVQKDYSTRADIDEYIYGSADVVGLMCLHVFCRGNKDIYTSLEPFARKLGSAFQKVNFLRDLKADVDNLGRSYFPELNGKTIDEDSKMLLVADIEADFREAFKGIKNLPSGAKLSVLVAYYYYMALLSRIRKTSAENIKNSRIRVPDWFKILLVGKAIAACKLGIV
jgi:15-cis-phytoene synthase